MFAANRTWNCTAPTLSSVTTHLLSTTHQSVALFSTISLTLHFRKFPLLSSKTRVVATAVYLGGWCDPNQTCSAERVSAFKTKTGLKNTGWLKNTWKGRLSHTKPLKIKGDVYHCLVKNHYTDYKVTCCIIVSVSWLFLKKFSISWNSYQMRCQALLCHGQNAMLYPLNKT